MSTLIGLLRQHPEAGVVALYLVAIGSHAVVGALLHLLRLGDFDWRKLGGFIEQDLATTRGLAILTTFAASLLTQLANGAAFKAAFGVSLAALVAACAAATAPIARDTLYELLQLVVGVEVPAKVADAKPLRA